ncbi:MAG TPA: LEA type 2 family protein [Xanthomonadales bacterium]|nr:LEA type 2 family protein [Xanthomonadales bacterium]
MKITNSSILIFACLFMTACGGGLVRGQPPLVGMSSLQSQQTEIQTRVDIYNPNGVDMMVQELEMSMTLGDTDLGSHNIQPGIKIYPNGTEEIGIEFPTMDAVRQTLADLESGDINSVPYTIRGRVFDTDGDSEQFSQDGYLYPLPGRPGEFRGAGPQRDGTRK